MRKNTRNYLHRDFSKVRTSDKLSKKHRSRRMSQIRSKNTKFEKEFFCALKGVTRKKFEMNVANILGKPDIVFRRYKLCVFLDSDFWHGWQFPRWKHLLKNDFWRTKIENNRVRDRKTTANLRRQGWKVLRIWEHSIKESIVQSMNRILSAL